MTRFSGIEMMRRLQMKDRGRCIWILAWGRRRWIMSPLIRRTMTSRRKDTLEVQV